MEEKETGGPAYPHTVMGDLGQTREVCEGMTLRDAFAKDAPISWEDAHFAWKDINGKDALPTLAQVMTLMAEIRYFYADCMLKERSK